MARRPGRKAPPSPLEQRDGVDPVCLRLPGDTTPVGQSANGNGDETGARPWAGGGAPTTVGAYLLERYGAAIGPAQVAEMLAAGRFVGEGGRPVDAATPYEAGAYIWFHRDLAPEVRVPFAIRVVHHDERIVVADKPHFLATTPRGRHVTETALARLRRDLELPRLSPAHRLDRLTAGLVLFVVRPEDRGTYQTLFRDRRVRKEYEAVAVHDPAVELPRTVSSRILKEHGVLAAQEVSGPVNAESRIELLGQRNGLGRYRLLPTTGRTHQLRVHMSALGLPLLNDPLYPEIAPLPPEDADPFQEPLQLLARALEFTDPWTERVMRFESTRELAAWRDQDAG